MSESSDPEPSAPPSPASEVTQLLSAWKRGDDEALERLIPAVYRELREIAARQMRGERVGHTLDPTALVNEAFLKLQGLRSIQWNDRAHFFAFSSRIMRRILVDHARTRLAAKRGSEVPHLQLLDGTDGLDAIVPPSIDATELIDLDRALDRLACASPRLARLVEVRFFGGLTVEEAADVLECSPRTVKRDWVFARAWLLKELGSRA